MLAACFEISIYIASRYVRCVNTITNATHIGELGIQACEALYRENVRAENQDG